jgi:dihydroorotate dehydrogenase electron transfer subunit
VGSGPRMASRVARVIRNERVEGGCHHVVAVAQGEWPATGAGQFAMLSTEHPRFPILPRPFSLLGWERKGGEDHLEWMIMPVGIATGILCSLRPGEELQAVGPLGRSMDEGLPEGDLVCVGGGYGIAPFIFLLDAWRRAGDARAASTTVLFGARTAERLSLHGRLPGGGATVELCTDDGTRGFAGRVDARLDALLAERARAGRPPALVLCCGPERMMEAVGEVARRHGVPGRASLETVMGCGFAVCNGCAVAVKDGRQPDGYTYELACREGTVFDESRLLWHPM